MVERRVSFSRSRTDDGIGYTFGLGLHSEQWPAVLHPVSVPLLLSIVPHSQRRQLRFNTTHSGAFGHEAPTLYARSTHPCR